MDPRPPRDLPREPHSFLAKLSCRRLATPSAVGTATVTSESQRVLRTSSLGRAGAVPLPGHLCLAPARTRRQKSTCIDTGTLRPRRPGRLAAAANGALPSVRDEGGCGPPVGGRARSATGRGCRSGCWWRRLPATAPAGGRRRMQLGARLRSLDANGGSCRAATLMHGVRCESR